MSDLGVALASLQNALKAFDLVEKFLDVLLCNTQRARGATALDVRASEQVIDAAVHFFVQNFGCKDQLRIFILQLLCLLCLCAMV